MEMKKGFMGIVGNDIMVSVSHIKSHLCVQIWQNCDYNDNYLPVASRTPACTRPFHLTPYLQKQEKFCSKKPWFIHMRNTVHILIEKNLYKGKQISICWKYIKIKQSGQWLHYKHTTLHFTSHCNNQCPALIRNSNTLNTNEQT